MNTEDSKPYGPRKGIQTRESVQNVKGKGRHFICTLKFDFNPTLHLLKNDLIPGFEDL